MKTISLILFLLLIPGFLFGEEENRIFSLCKTFHVAASFGDYLTTYHASRFDIYQELNPITRLYWRSPPAFCTFKAVEVFLLNQLFSTIYKKNKFIAYVTVAVFTTVRIWAIRDNCKAMRIR